MLIKIILDLFSPAFSLLDFILDLLPDMPDGGVNVTSTVFEFLIDAVAPFYYPFALNHMFIALSPVLAYLGFIAFMNIVAQIKMLIKWW